MSESGPTANGHNLETGSLPAFPHYSGWDFGSTAKTTPTNDDRKDPDVGLKGEHAPLSAPHPGSSARVSEDRSDSQYFASSLLPHVVFLTLSFKKCKRSKVESTCT